MLKKLKRLPQLTKLWLGKNVDGIQPDGVNVHAAINNAVKIRCQNVADYFWTNPKDQWRMNDFPNIAPSWRLAWFDWTRPPCTDVLPRFGVGDGGALLMAFQINEDNGPNISDVTGETIRWGFVWLVYMELGNSIQLAQFIHYVSDKGRAIPKSICPDGLGIYESQLIFPKGRGADYGQAVTNAAFIELSIPLLALTFANCSNTKVIAEPAPTFKPKVARRMTAEGRKPTRWHLLEIGGTTRVLRNAVDDDGKRPSSLKRRLHITRGHFKDFTEGKGLFGQHHGLYWWDQMTRGEASKGRALKDYSIKSETPNNATV